MEYLVLFFTQAGALKYHRYLAGIGVKGELKPVPRKLSSSCGIAASFRYNGDLSMLINKDVERIYTIANDTYLLQYEVED